MSPSSALDIEVEKHKREIKDYWESLVKEVEKKPQSDKKSVLKTRSLLSGNNYRRMFEPLDIAEYYHKPNEDTGRRTNYRTSGRSHHYVMLEKWFKAEVKEPIRDEKTDLRDLLTFDSCFWSEVEEAMIVMNSMKAHEGMRDEASIGKLVEFEKYVWGMIEKREVSPEIFLKGSSFMEWWEEYKGIEGFSSSLSEFTEFMHRRMFKSYGRSAEVE